MLGSTGNLRAPTIRTGNRLLVGFNEDVYREVLK
jgi:arsenate reductase-like glutaredoxin family protein